jgi:uncharacterized membrane protein
MDTSTYASTPALAPRPAGTAPRATPHEPIGGKAQATARLDSIDLLRGVLMVIMLIDHTRECVHRDGLSIDPLALATTTPLLYFTRWITHLCAPGFVFLAGASAGFQRRHGTSTAALSRFLWTRGLSLVAMELTIVRLVGSFNVDTNYLANLQVIWVIGLAMIVLAALVHLPRPAVLAVGLAIVCGHNLLDRIHVPAWTSPLMPAPTTLEKVWMLLHQSGLFPLFGYPTPIVRVLYPLLPWIGVMAVGYVFAGLWSMPADRRRRAIWWLGVTLTAAFVLLRAANVYGDPLPWQPQDTLFRSIASFMNVQKYPPSLLYVMATLGPCLIFLALLQGRTFTNPLGRALVTYGRVPMFFYLLQWLWAHVCGLVVLALRGMPLAAQFQSRADTFLGAPAPVFGGTLRDVYVCWLLGAIVLYFPCRWYAGVKGRRKDLTILRYL